MAFPWVTAFGLLGNIISFMVYLSPIPTFYQVYKKKSTEGFQSVPYVVALFSSMLWLFYACFAPDSILLVTINSFGLFIETIYISIFLFYGTKHARKTTLMLIGGMNVVGFGLITLVTLVFLHDTPLRIKVLGWINLIFAFCVFVAPLGVVRQVIRTKSVKYMPFFLSFFLTVSAVMWFFYGLLKKDYYVAIPNVLGFTFGLIQMIVYAIYKNAKPIEIAKDIEEQKIPAAELSTNQIIEVVKLNGLNLNGSQEITIVQSPKPNNDGDNDNDSDENNNNNNLNAVAAPNNVYTIEVRTIDEPRGTPVEKIISGNNITVEVAA